MLDKTKRKKFFATSVMCLYSQAPCKRRYYYHSFDFWYVNNSCVYRTPALSMKYSLYITCCVRLHILLQFVACYWELLRKAWNLSNFWPTNSVIAEAKRKNVGSVLHSSSYLVGATHAHHTWSIWILQSLMGFILPTIHWSVQHCWKWKKFNATAAHFHRKS